MAISIGDLLGQDEAWVFIFLLGAALLNWPLLSLATGTAKIFGYPTILIYLATVWLLIIIFGYIYDRRDSG